MIAIALGLVRILVGLVALVAGALKLAQRSDSAAGFQKLLGISPAVSRLFTFTLAIVEVGVGGLLIAGVWMPVVAPLAAAMFGVFGLVVVFLLTKGESGRSCGCMGRKGRIGATLAAQDFGLMLLSVGLWLGPAHAAFSFVLAVGALLFLAPAANRLSGWRRARGIRLEPATGPAQR